MIKSGSAVIGILATTLTTTAFAQEANELYIFKMEGEMPRVEAQGVDTMGAAQVHEFLGEDFIVFNGTRSDLAAMSTDPVRPIPFPEDDPVLPICQCPEDYTALLSQRATLPEIAELFRPQQVFIDQNAFPQPGTDQMRRIEQLFQENGSLILRGQ